MDKRIEKRHKRQVARAKAKVRTSEPDVRTPEQIAEARAASKPSAQQGNAAHLPNTPQRAGRATGVMSAGKTDA